MNINKSKISISLLISLILILSLNIHLTTCISKENYLQKLLKLDFKEIEQDIIKMFHDSKESWPADYGNYGPLFIRLAWHCAGTYRISDGRGGCDGADQRFDPLRSWDDNTNLDKARKLLVPIKLKYGPGLSWGDLIIFTGTIAIKHMGGPVLGFCAGRYDLSSSEESSVIMGPTIEQEKLFPCKVNGQCKSPFGATTINLIYVNPEGPMGQPDPVKSSDNVRDTFGRMSMNDEETVALIGGGHAFGKAHGACPLGPGNKPKDDEEHPWEGKCGDGKGANTVTSGIEGPWTTDPTKFDNEYFHNLLNYKWEAHIGPGGKNQWKITTDIDNDINSDINENKGGCPYARSAHKNTNNTHSNKEGLMMLTTDISLINDPEYLKIVRKYADDPELFATNFKNAWYKLVTRDIGPYTRCVDKGDLPPPQDFQYPLPAPNKTQPDWSEVINSIKDVMYSRSVFLIGDTYNNQNYYGEWYVKLAWQCASTFRKTDYQGGCNGARIRFSPQKDWDQNFGMEETLQTLRPVKAKFGDELSWADLIIIAGNTALEDMSGSEFDFCPGRSDDNNYNNYNDYYDNKAWQNLNIMKYPSDIAEFNDRRVLLNLTNREMVALKGMPRSYQSQRALGYKGTWMNNDWGNNYFKLLLSETWVSISDNQVQSLYTEDVYMMKSDTMLLLDPELFAIVQDYAADEELFMGEFKKAWFKVMNNDMFDGPVSNLCEREGAVFNKMSMSMKNKIKSENIDMNIEMNKEIKVEFLE